MKPLALSFLLLALSLPASALSPEAESYLSTIGIDPASEDVRLADADGEIATTHMDQDLTFSVELLAAGKKKNQLTNFIAMRAFVSRLKKDFDSTKVPTKNYASLYLTADERPLVGRKIALSLLSDASRPADASDSVTAASGEASTEERRRIDKTLMTPALSSEAAAFIKSTDLDPASAEVKLAHADGTISSTYRGHPVSNSLEALVKAGSTKGVFSFVTSRTFIRKLKADFKGTDFPKIGYDGIYLTGDERLLVVDKIVERAAKN